MGPRSDTFGAAHNLRRSRVVEQTPREQQPDCVRRDERTFLSAVVAPDVEGANPGQALSAGSDVSGNQHAAAGRSGRLIITTTFRPILLQTLTTRPTSAGLVVTSAQLKSRTRGPDYPAPCVRMVTVDRRFLPSRCSRSFQRRRTSISPCPSR